MITSRSNRRLNLLKVCFSGFLLLPLSVLLGNDSTHTKDIPEHTLIKIEPFHKATANSNDFPSVYLELDSLLEVFYNRTIQYPEATYSKKAFERIDLDSSKYSDTYLKKVAAALIQTHFYPRSYFYQYFQTVNTDVKQYYLQIDKDRRNGIARTEIQYPLPGWVMVKYFGEQLIPQKLGWEYNLLLQNQYILVVKPISKETRVFDPQVRIGTGLYYEVEVLNDLKGNFTDNQNILVTHRREFLEGLNKEMMIGNKYVILIQSVDEKGAYGPAYLLRGSPITLGRGIFSVVDEEVKDMEKILYPQKQTYDIIELKTRLGDFIGTNIDKY